MVDLLQLVACLAGFHLIKRRCPTQTQCPDLHEFVLTQLREMAFRRRLIHQNQVISVTLPLPIYSALGSRPLESDHQTDLNQLQSLHQVQR